VRANSIPARDRARKDRESPQETVFATERLLEVVRSQRGKRSGDTVEEPIQFDRLTRCR
jgi:hypothetical protein